MSIYESINRYRFLSIDYSIRALNQSRRDERMVLVYRLDADITNCYRKQASHLFDCHTQKLRFVQSLALADLFVGFFFPRAAFQFQISCKYALVIKDIAMLSIYSSFSTVRHGSKTLSRHLEISSVYFDYDAYDLSSRSRCR